VPDPVASPPDVIRSYHGQPVLKEPIWTWEIPCYFFTGGLAGASAGLAYGAGLRGNQVLARRAWDAAATGVLLSPALLISDLGRPERFLHMLRMFKVTSPMSVGTWILSASGATTTLAALNQRTGRFPRLARAARPAAALLGLPLATYTGALVANTAVPAWHESRRLLPFVFGSGAALSAGAAAVVATPPRDAAPARRLALAGALLEVGLKQTMERQLGPLGEPYHQGAGARLGHLAQGLIGAGSALLAARGRSSRAAAATAGTLLLGGAMAARWSVFKAGAQSAADPRYVIGPQRSAIQRGERPGASRRQAGVASPEPSRGSPATAVWD
jgi:hypothetical protein